MSTLLSHIRAVGSRLRGAWQVWAALLILLVALWWAFGLAWPSDAELRISLVGMLLQLAGVSTVAYGVAQTRRRFGKVPMGRAVRDYFANLFSKPRVINADIHEGSLALSGTAASVTVGHATLTTSLEDRVATLEAQLNVQAGKIQELRDQLRAEANAREQALNAEHSARAQADGEIRQFVDDVQTGGVVVTMAGLLWLVFGVILTSVPGWLACLAVGG